MYLCEVVAAVCMCVLFWLSVKLLSFLPLWNLDRPNIKAEKAESATHLPSPHTLFLFLSNSRGNDKWRRASVIAQLDKAVCVHMCAYSVLWSARGRQRANKHNHYNVFGAQMCKITRVRRVLMKEKANCVVKRGFKAKCNINDSCVFCSNSDISIQATLQ